MTWKITTYELLTRYNAGERNFAGVELIVDQERNVEDTPYDIHGLEGADLRGINLCGANLQNVILERANLTEANLFGACLARADLSDAIAIKANLCSANLSRSGCQRADFTNADLSLVNAVVTSFAGAKFGFIENAVLASANFKGSNISKDTLCRYGNLICETVMADGSIESGFYYGHW